MFGWLRSRTKDGGTELSIVALVKRLADDGMRLLRAELRLAQAEVKHSISELAMPIAMLMLGMLLSVAALFTLMGAFVGWLTPVVGAGFAALIVAVVTGAIAAGLMLAAKKKIATVELMPSRAVAALREDIETLKGE